MTVATYREGEGEEFPIYFDHTRVVRCNETST
jgi:hypothetical protein